MTAPRFILLTRWAPDHGPLAEDVVIRVADIVAVESHQASTVDDPASVVTMRRPTDGALIIFDVADTPVSIARMLKADGILDVSEDGAGASAYAVFTLAASGVPVAVMRNRLVSVTGDPNGTRVSLDDGTRDGLVLTIRETLADVLTWLELAPYA